MRGGSARVNQLYRPARLRQGACAASARQACTDYEDAGRSMMGQACLHFDNFLIAAQAGFMAWGLDFYLIFWLNLRLI